MSDFTVKRIDEMEAAFGGSFVKARAELGVSAFGIQIIQLPPDFSDYPEHDHVDDGQEEVYMALGGSGSIEIDGEHTELGPDVFVRVGPTVRRKLYAGSDGLRVLALGGAPGEAYKIKSFSELGA
jgi:mannose-6-phosphate isomerase-like protein (cupin superfamily)